MRRMVIVLLLGFLAVPAGADDGPVIVIPGRAGVPVMINGRDASFAVVEGDWGLSKSAHPPPTVIYGWRAVREAPAAHYFPSTGHMPGYGRHEIEPPPDRPLPPQAESFQRNWAIESQPTPATSSPPYDPPPVILAPPEQDRRGRRDRMPPLDRRN